MYQIYVLYVCKTNGADALSHPTLQLISIQDELCARGYWSTPENVCKEDVPGWFAEKIEKLGLADLKDALYFPQGAGKH